MYAKLPPLSAFRTSFCRKAPLSCPAGRSAVLPSQASWRCTRVFWCDTILSQIKAYHEKTGITVLLVSHSMEDIAKYANRVLVMHRAKIAMYDTVEKVFAHAQQLLALGLSVPQVTQIFLKLRQMGLDIPADVYTIPYAVKTIRRALAAKQAGEVQ